MISLYNTLTKKIEEFSPIEKGKVKIYACGPTVYDHVHIGNLRTYIMNDLIKRTFEYLGYEVRLAMNITDIDDKTIKKSKEIGENLKSFTRKYEQVFYDDLVKLNILKPDEVLRATENIGGMIEIISILLQKEYAYKATDGIYFKVEKFPEYGKLVGKERFTGHNQNRIANDEYDKENASDFALWKFYKDDDGDVVFDAPFGKGRPGWHIECSAMSRKALGQPFDLHTGAVDLIFPHHTNEIAQSECAFNTPLANFWIHGGFLNIGEDKMSKSKKNFFRLSDIEENGISPLAFRYLTLGTHYRCMLNFSYESLESAERALNKLRNAVLYLPKDGNIIESAKASFIKILENDMNIPQALAIAHEVLKSQNKPEDIRVTILDFDKVFGLNLIQSPKATKNENVEIPKEVKILIEERQKAREVKDFKKSDEIREQIEKLGYKVTDGIDGTSVS